MNEYKACGAQLEVSPDAKGVPFDKWAAARPVASRADIDAWREKQQKEESKTKPSASKTTKQHSGALPGNTEWL